ncbi:MAG: type II toxin-antitoxin system VapC family toxin [Chloroflexi bacterium]|nr:type II toxin-antitoxin system VapC family toxin [Chloroflexota bacterium]
MPNVVCLDASFLLPPLLPEARTPAARGLWRQWATDSTVRVISPLFLAEVTSVLGLSVFTGKISPEQGETAFADFTAANVVGFSPPDLQPRAWAFAKQFNLPRTYDAQYLAVAAALGLCVLRTVRLTQEETPPSVGRTSVRI